MKPTVEMLRELTREVLAGTLDRPAAAERAASFGSWGPYAATFRGVEADGHHYLMARCAANLSAPWSDGPPYFFRDSDLLYSLEQMDGINASWDVAENVVQERRWSGPEPEDLGRPAYLGTIRSTPERLEARSGIRFIRGIDDLDVEIFANLRMYDRPFRLSSRHPFEGIDMECWEGPLSAQIETLRRTFETFGIDLSDLEYVNESVDTSALPRWTLWRQDDNGNQFDMAVFTSRLKAESEARRFEAKGHKQTYGVRPG